MSVAPDNGNDDCLIGTNTDSRKVQPCPDSKVHQRSVSDVCRSLKKEWWICSVCLELMCKPHSTAPCSHQFCQTCLQMLASRHPARTVCPLCRSVITNCVYDDALDRQIQQMFPAEHLKQLEKSDSDKLLPGQPMRRQLSVFSWLKFTLGNREHRHAETTDRVLWHFCSFVIMITAFICCLYLGHFVIAASRFVPYYMPSVLEDFKLDNVPLALLAVFSLVVLILR